MVTAGKCLARAWLIGALAFGSGDAAASDPETREIMHEIVGALQVALPPSLDAERFDDPANREPILAALAKLAKNAERLGEHGETGDAGFAFLSRSLASDAREVERRFAAGRPEEARFLLHHVTEVCVACHSTLPDDEVRVLGRKLITSDAIASLPPDDRVQFEMATRQFDAASASFDALFADPDVSPGDLDLTGFYESYLELCLRVRHDPDHAIATLERLQKREDVPARLRGSLASWIRSLRELRDAPDGEPALARARSLLASAEDRERFPKERDALVPYVAASGLLHRFVASGAGTPAEVGEAYYLLGVIESNIGRSFWTSQTEDFLAAAIRTGPGEPYAEPAYSLLEEFVVASYSGSAGEHVPDDVRQSLQSLRAAIDAARPAAP